MTIQTRASSLATDDTAQPSAAKQLYDFWPPLPEGRFDCYASLSQLELWLRELVYLELKTRYGINWSQHLVGAREGPQKADSQLTHMPTRERSPLSYLTFNNLTKTISKHRRLFAPYLPKKSIWDARIEEVSQVRNRVAHFRQGDDDDLSRVKQLMDDLDKGIWHFCTSYNDPQPIYPPERDKVAHRFLDLDPFARRGTGKKNATVPASYAAWNMVMGVTIEKLRRPWLKSKPPTQIAGKCGYLYRVKLYTRDNKVFNYKDLLSETKNLHENCCHIFLDYPANTIRLTLPAILGPATLIDTIDQFIKETERTTHPQNNPFHAGGVDSMGGVKSIVQAWPEYVLGPTHPFSCLDPDTPPGGEIFSMPGDICSP